MRRLPFPILKPTEMPPNADARYPHRAHLSAINLKDWHDVVSGIWRGRDLLSRAELSPSPFISPWLLELWLKQFLFSCLLACVDLPSTFQDLQPAALGRGIGNCPSITQRCGGHLELPEAAAQGWLGSGRRCSRLPTSVGHSAQQMPGPVGLHRSYISSAFNDPQQWFSVAKQHNAASPQVASLLLVRSVFCCWMRWALPSGKRSKNDLQT